MASGDINLNLNVLDKSGSIKSRTQEAKELNRELDKAANRPTGTRSGSMAAYRAGAVPSPDEGVEYNRGRGVAGITGAGARDFANQAQGLGGLVRLYATWAANIYAVGAAFTALENAFQKTRTLEAAEMLGQRVGLSMRGLAKDLQEVSNYALSLEQATQFANLGTSAGISGTQQRNLVQIATGAAAATGRDTQDAIRRIIQGTAKQEQEILDELGIFIKAKDAYERYAKEFDIKGGAEALSAQQRLAAYANEVERAGEKWKDFASIEDPFAKFKAKGSEAIFSILEVVNQGLKPILSFLAESEGAITSLALLISVSLTKRALPELGNAIRDAFNFTKYANEAKAREDIDKYTKIFEDATDRIQSIRDRQASLAKNIPDARAEFTSTFAQDLGGRQGSQQRVTTAIFGTESKPVDLSKYKQVADVEKAISVSLKEQVSAAADKEQRLQKLIQLGLVEKTSTTESLVLSEKAKKIAAETLVLLERQVAVKSQIASLELQAGVAVQAQEQAMNTLESIEKTGGGYVKSIMAANSATGIFARSVAGARATLAAFQAGLGAASAASAILTANLSGGFISSLLNIRNTISQLGGLIAASTVGLTGMAAAASAAGTAVGVLSAAVSRLIGFILGPVMIAVTLWQLFGDKILRLVGITSEYDDAIKKIKETEAERLKGLTATVSALDRVNKEQRAGVTSAKQDEEFANRRLQIIINRRSELDKLIQKLDEAKEAQDRLDKSGAKGTVAEDGGITFASSQDEVKYWKTLSKEAKGYEQDVKVIYDGLADIAAQRGKIERGEIKLTKQEQTVALNELSRASLILERQRIGIAERVAGAETASIEKVKQALGNSTDDVLKRFDKLLGKTEEFEGSKLFKNDTIREFAKNMVNTVGLLAQLPTTATSSIKTATEGLLEYANKAQQAGVDMAEYIGILTAIQLLAQNLSNMDMSESARGAAESLLQRYQQQLKEIQGKTTTALASSRANTGGAKSRPDLVDMPDFAKRIAAVEKAGNVELEILRNNNDAALKLTDIRERGLVLSADTAYSDRNKIITQSEQQELELLKSNRQERTAEYQRALKEAQDVYAKNVAKAGKDTEALQSADKAYNNTIVQLVNSQEAFVDITDKRIAQINSNKTIREAENQAQLNRRLVEGARAVSQLRQSYEDFWDDERFAQRQDREEQEFTSRNRLSDPETQAVEAARFRESQRYDRLIRQQERDVRDLDRRFQTTTDFTEASSLFDQLAAAEDQLKKLKQEAPNSIARIGEQMRGAFRKDAVSSQIQAVEDRFKQAFTSIGDKIEEFVRTGKTSFKDLFQSLLSDLIKMELRWQFSSMWDAMRGNPKAPGSGPLSMGFDWLKGFLNKGSAATTSTSSMDLAGGSADLLMAKGGAFDYAMPVNKFAQGGTFTNSIVSSPTLFKFAQGTGLMGEAGPEAIMPLTRDSSGTLGVRAQGANQPAPKVDVVVINNSKDKAETKETTDSRGNRRIEVIVGDMVSGEMSRPGSATQSAMRSNFNLTPALVRR